MEYRIRAAPSSVLLSGLNFPAELCFSVNSFWISKPLFSGLPAGPPAKSLLPAGGILFLQEASRASCGNNTYAARDCAASSAMKPHLETRNLPSYKLRNLKGGGCTSIAALQKSSTCRERGLIHPGDRQCH